MKGYELASNKLRNEIGELFVMCMSYGWHLSIEYVPNTYSWVGLVYAGEKKEQAVTHIDGDVMQLISTLRSIILTSKN